ncbi:uncharacterized protein PFL1_01502 [Pseudozyma flocculosa PF-1]|uniref:Uncharacterized protein n=1 Tax=Pseudozyma flocculosa TaxID=84751 RepID=A0A5C3FE79_9BASI|nr:uncharacterized protein PFL1_01502 [Pseudozyma flocculosa PF-1]EPQ31317.1 hypothetical protein PFL1_01502 [Pseudozyma flocculosa PF-1]SPO41781.1 uncharacterized protein PSFLO_07263 [Pseudozyma flocculosa]
MSNGGGHYSFAPPQHEPGYRPMSTSPTPPSRLDNRSVSPSSGKPKFWPFNRSRSASPNDQAIANPTNNRSRKTSAGYSPARGASPNSGGFVVRTVTRQPGGVSAPTSPVSDAPYQPDWSRAAQPSPRRMTLEDSDDDAQQPTALDGRHQLQYRRSKSRPIASALSLSVPAGGPGGGVGYGTATSSNDGRPEPHFAAPQMSAPRPASPGGASMTAGGFQKSLQERGRSPRKAPSGQSLGQQQQQQQGHQQDRSRSRSAHSAKGGDDASVATTPSGKVIRPMITPGPRSLAQQSSGSDGAESTRPVLSAKTSFQSIRPQGLTGPRQFPGSARPSFDGAPPSPHEMHGAPAYRQPSPLGYGQSPGIGSGGPGPATSATSPVHANGSASPRHGPTGAASVGHFSDAVTASGQEAPSPSSRGRKFSFGFTRGRKASDAAAVVGGQAPVGPLDGLPSPVDIPYGRGPGSGFASRSRSRDPGAETDYSYENGASPFGSVSPAGSPGFLSSMAASRGGDGGAAGYVGRSASPGGSSLAGKWFKGIFGKSPQAGDNDQDWRGAPMYPNANLEAAVRSREGSPLPALPSNAQAERQALAPRQPPNQGRRSQTLPNPPPSEDDVEALLQKRQSMKQARRIVDAERRELMSPTTQQRGFDPDRDREYRPKQAVDDPSEDYEANLHAERRKSPPGRKPVPRIVDRSQDDSLSRLEGRLTPAQKIIQETRSMHLARESLEGRNGSPRTTAATAAEDATKDPKSSDVGRSAQQASAVQSSGKDLASRPAQSNEPEQAVRRGASAGGSSKAKDKGKRREESSSSQAPPASAGPARQQQQDARREWQQHAAPHARASLPHPGELAQAPKPASNLAAKAPPAGSKATSALSPGSGPMPLDMSLPQALQEMMVRFYRFERYSVPLIRSLETRLIDIERDAMMASNPQAGGRSHVETASQHEEMDRWVGQMTMLMKHEVGQLKAAAREIREGRELVAQVAKGLGSFGAGIGGSSSLPTFSSIGTLPAAEATAAATTLDMPQRTVQLEGKDVTDSPSSTKGDTGVQPPSAAGTARKQASAASGSETSRDAAMAQRAAPGSQSQRNDHDAARRNNVSSSSFRSAVPVAHSSGVAGASSAPGNLVLPPGSRPALDKNEGKFGSPTKATFGFSEPDATSRRERSTSPGGRPRYTSALGQPMHDGRLSPGATSPVRSYPDPEVRAGIASPGRWAGDQRKFSQTLVASPAVSDQASIHSGVSGQSAADRPKREISVEERLKALMDGTSIRSRASSFAGSMSERDVQDDNDEGAQEPQPSTPARVGDDYAPAPEGELVEGRSNTQGQASRATVGQEGEEDTAADDGRERRRQSASQSTTATTSTDAHTIRPGAVAGAGARSAGPPVDAPTRPLVFKRNTGEIAKRASAFLEAGNGNTPTNSSREASPIGDTASSARVDFPSSSARRSPSPAAANELSAPAAISPAVSRSSSSGPSPNTANSVRQRALSYLSTAGAGAAAEDRSRAASVTPAEGPEADDDALPTTPSKAISPSSWLASSSSPPSSSSPTKFRGGNASTSSNPGSATIGASSAPAGPQSGRISPSKLHANRFASPDKDARGGGSSSPLASPTKKAIGLPTQGGAGSGVASRWSANRKEGSDASGGAGVGRASTGIPGLGVEKKRSFGPVAAIPALAAGAGSVGGASKGPTMVGHAATLKERVAFFDSVK